MIPFFFLLLARWTARPFRWGGIFLFMLTGAVAVLATDEPTPGPDPIEQSPSVLRVAIDADNPPLSFLDAEGKPAGFSVDLLEAIGRDRRLRFEYRAMPWVQAHEEFKAGRVDILANVIWSPSLQGLASFAVPHAALPGALFVRKGLPAVRSLEDLRKLRIVASEDSAGLAYIQTHRLAETPQLVHTRNQGLELIEQGGADATLALLDLGLQTIRERNYRQVAKSSFRPPDFDYTIHFGVPFDRPELLAELNLGLHRLRENGTHARLYRRWIGPLEAFRRSWHGFRTYGLSFMLIAAGLLAAFLFQWHLVKKLRRQTAALEISEERLTLALEGSEDAFWDWDAVNGRVSRSERWAEIIGCRADEIAPQIDALNPLVHPDDLERMEAAKRAIMRDGTGRSEYRLKARDGAWRWIFDRGKVVARAPDGRPTRITGAASDITIRKRIEAALVRSQALLEQTQLAAEMGGWEFDLRNRTFFCTKETFRIYDLPTGDEPLSEERVLDFCVPKSRELFSAALDRALLTGQSFDLELELVTANSRLIWVRCIGRVEFAGEKVARLFGSIQDITRLKKADEDRQKLQLKMLEAQKLESLGILAGGIAHDFNNLLTVILGNASLARADAASAPDALEHIETAANRAADLCRQMLSYAGKSRFSLEPCDLNVLVRDTAHLFRTSITKNAQIEFDLCAASLVVSIDASQIRQVVMNLVINASDAIGLSPGKIRLHSARRMFTAEALREARIGQDGPPGDYAILEVTDNGSGMSAETISRIFDPFFTTKFTGRGLGLAAVLGIVRAHQGAFFVRSTLGKGSIFTLALPPAAGPVANVDHAPSPMVVAEEKASGTILVVDDEPQVRKIAAAILEKQGFTVALASDGYEALALALAHGMRFKAVLLDLTMPGLDGPATLRELRGLSKNVPVLIMSGYSETDARKQLITAPLIEFLPKPFAAEDLLRRITALVAQADPNDIS